jgi:hypothetical protein
MTKLLEKLASKLPHQVRDRVVKQIDKFKRKELKGLMTDNVKRVNKETMLTSRSKLNQRLAKENKNDEKLSASLKGSAVRDRFLRKMLGRKYVRSNPT